MDKIDLLYIHPFTFAGYDRLIPLGIIELMNSVRCKKVGVFQAELSDTLIRKARIIVIDCHWYGSLYPMDILIKRVKKVNPFCHVIIGGNTATVFCDIIMEKFDVDFLIQGCAEKPFKLLVEGLLRGERCDKLPNVLTRKRKNKISYFLNEKDYATVDYSNLSWFKSRDKPYMTWLTIERYCAERCGLCFIERRKILRSYVLPASQLKRILTHSSNNQTSLIILLLKFAFDKDYAKDVFSRSYPFQVSFCFEENLPSIAVVDYILKSCEKCVFRFPTFSYVKFDKKPIKAIEQTCLMSVRLKSLLDFLRNKKCLVMLEVDKGLAKISKEYAAKIIELSRKYRVKLRSSINAYQYVPIYNMDCDVLEDQFNHLYHLSKREFIFTHNILWRIIAQYFNQLRDNKIVALPYDTLSLHLWHYIILIQMKLILKLHIWQERFRIFKRLIMTSKWKST